MSMNLRFLFFFANLSVSGCKSNISFYSGKKKIILFFTKCFYQIFKFFRKAKIQILYPSNKLLSDFFFFDLKEPLLQCGCKSSAFIQFCNPFSILFLKYFLINWKRVGWMKRFFEITMIQSKFAIKSSALAPIEVEIPRSLVWIITNSGK